MEDDDFVPYPSSPVQQPDDNNCNSWSDTSVVPSDSSAESDVDFPCFKEMVQQKDSPKDVVNICESSSNSYQYPEKCSAQDETVICISDEEDPGDVLNRGFVSAGGDTSEPEDTGIKDDTLQNSAENALEIVDQGNASTSVFYSSHHSLSPTLIIASPARSTASDGCSEDFKPISIPEQIFAASTSDAGATEQHIHLLSSSSDSEDSLPPLSQRLTQLYKSSDSAKDSSQCDSDKHSQVPTPKLSPGNQQDEDDLFGTQDSDYLNLFAFKGDLNNKEKAKKSREEKAMEREQKKKEKQKEQLLNKAKNEMKQSEKPKECLKFITVVLDKTLLELKGARDMLDTFQPVDVKYTIEDQLLPGLVTWRREVVEDILVQDDLQVNKVTTELDVDQALLLVPLPNFLQMVYAFKAKQQGDACDGQSTLLSYFQETQDLLKKKLTLVVVGLESHFKTQKRKANKDFKSAVLGDPQPAPGAKRRKRKDALPPVSRLEVEEALVALQVEEQANVCFLETGAGIGKLVSQFTKAIAEAPYKLEKRRLHRFTTYIEGNNARTVKIGPQGEGLSEVWQQQLEQFNNVSKDVARAIVAKHPTPQSLIQAYQQLPVSEARFLLKDIVVQRGAGTITTARRVGQELSKRVHLFFTNTDGKTLLYHHAS